jgi:membrane associated rhomboid family serine protease
MLECPSCGAHLVRQQRPEGILYACGRCKGLAATLPVIRRAGAKRDFLNSVWLGARQPNAPRVRRCPHCGLKMSQTTPRKESVTLTLDVCKRCAMIWFDSKEYVKLPRGTAPVVPLQPKPSLAPKAAEAVVMRSLERLKEREESDEPDAIDWLPALFGMPAELNAPKLSGIPWLTWTLALLCIAATVPVLRESPAPLQPVEVIRQWGFIPMEWSRHYGLTLITSFFLHAGLVHLISNIYFLVVFGDNVEDRLKRSKYVLLLFFSQLAGAVLHGLLDPRPGIPLVGASAGISGVLAYYAIAFPGVRIGFMWRIYFHFRWFRMRVAWALALFVAMQIIGAVFQIKGFSSVSAFGHLGGVAVGLGAGILGRLAQRGRRAGILRSEKEVLA